MLQSRSVIAIIRAGHPLPEDFFNAEVGRIALQCAFDENIGTD